MKVLSYALLTFALSFCVTVLVLAPENLEAPGGPASPASAVVAIERLPAPVSLFFVGDIMLGRAVEGLMEEHGADYPFLGSSSTVASPDLAVGNFEAVVALEHVRAPSMTFRFSVKEQYLRELASVGFDVLSLANNHSLDYGVESLAHTKRLCRDVGISCGGYPRAIGNDSFALREVGPHRIGFVFLSTVWGEQNPDELRTLLSQARASSTFLVAYVHWGVEYDLVHGEEQEALARTLIDGGADAIIGHHPHVVQDVALYRGKPIFYSLGNFIFDQYFSEEVEEGLGISLTLTEETARYRLVPFRNDRARSQPHTAGEGERVRLFDRILRGLAEHPDVDVSSGVITIPRGEG